MRAIFGMLSPSTIRRKAVWLQPREKTKNYLQLAGRLSRVPPTGLLALFLWLRLQPPAMILHGSISCVPFRMFHLKPEPDRSLNDPRVSRARNRPKVGVGESRRRVAEIDIVECVKRLQPQIDL